MRLLILLLWMLVSLLPSDEAQIRQALASKVTFLKTVEPGSEVKDLQFLSLLIKDKRVISLGEATHGTSEFFKAKHRLIEYLVEQEGYRLFAIEENFALCVSLNEYVLHGKGEPKQLLTAFYVWPWQTQEVLTMISWMRAYNIKQTDAKEKLKFFGFDMQQGYDAMEEVKSFFEQTDPHFYQRLTTTNPSIINKKEKIMYVADSATIEQVHYVLHKNKNHYQSLTSEKMWLHTLQYANILRQHYQMRQMYEKVKLGKATYRLLTQSRDSSMAMNVKWILEQEGEKSKIVLWAHNAHISQGGYPGYKDASMGSYLKKIYGKQVYAIGFDCMEGKYTGLGGRPRKLGVQTLPKVEEGTFTDILSQLDKPIVYLDFAKAAESTLLKEWLKKPQTIRYHGSTSTGILPECFDALLFIRNTAATNPLYPIDK